MFAASRRPAVVAGIWLLLAVFACDNGSKSPLTGPPGVSDVAVVRVELQAPTELAPDDSIQLTANAVLANGSVENVNSRAIWSVSAPQVLQISSNGVLTAKSPGEGVIAVHYGNRSASARIVVLRKGTFRLSGIIRERTVPLPGVTVTVIAGEGEGLTATTDSTGTYTLYGVAGTISIRLRRDGYVDGVQQITVTDHRTADFELVASRARPDFGGTYTMTVTAATNCRSLPPAAVKRQYTANVTQNGPLLSVVLQNGDFIVTNGRGNNFTGSIFVEDQVTFNIGDVYMYYDYLIASVHDIVERVDGMTIMTDGVATTRGTPTLLTGTLNGSIWISSQETPPFFPLSTYCGSTAHGFEMVRR